MKIDNGIIINGIVYKKHKTIDGFSYKEMGDLVDLVIDPSPSYRIKKARISSVYNMVNGHESVDLGLSVKWASRNVGAESPSDYGDYFAWGEIQTKPSYIYDNSVTWEKEMGDIAGNPLYDVARAKWGGTWRLPTLNEIEELANMCDHEWAVLNDHYGCMVTGPSGNSIFLPANGYLFGKTIKDIGVEGFYWGSTPMDDKCDACMLGFFGDELFRHWSHRAFARTVRPVTE